MASIIFMARGINLAFDNWKRFMESQMWPWIRQPLVRKQEFVLDESGNPKKDKDGKFMFKAGDFIKNEDGTYVRGPKTITQVQGSLRPIQLFEYTVPEECIPQVLAMQNLHKMDKLRPEAEKIGWIIRKGMKLDKIELPEDIKKKEKWEITMKHVPMEGMAVYPLGVKKDLKQDYPQYGFYQEGL